ncbi:hypothetical protein BHE74_00021325 [Ensete ventricosum]|nr:hypothetical protein BHE74_00021325 [Ensete ventricosum]
MSHAIDRLRLSSFVFSSSGGQLVVDGAKGLCATGRAMTLVFRASWFSLSSYSHAKEIAVVIVSPSSHRRKSTLVHRHDEFVAYSFIFVGFYLRSKLSLCCDLLRLGDRPNLNSVKRACSLSSICVSMASNLAPIKSVDVMV